MKLLRQNDKIVLYDDVKDQYIQVDPDDLDHILNDDNELYDDETIRHYFNFKLGKYQIKNQKGYQSKKANLKEEYKQQMTQTQKNYLINQFLSGIYGLSDNDKLMFIKNPTLSTIKKFSVDEQSKNKLIDKFEKINKSYITFKDEGNDIDDMINYFNKNNVPVEVPQVIKASIYKLIDEYEKNEIDQQFLKNAILSYKDKFYNPAKPNAFSDFFQFIKKIIINKEATRKTPIEPKPKDDKVIKPIETKEIKEAKEILNDVLPDNKINKVFLAEDFGNNKEAADKANTLNDQKQLTTKSLFSDSTFNEYNDNYFAQNSKFYRIFKYLTDKDLLKDYEVKTTDDDNIKEVILNLKEDDGQIKINIDKNQFLGDEIEKVLKNNSDIDEIFKGDNIDINMIKSKSKYQYLKPYEYIYKDKNINELIKDDTIKIISDDISNFEFNTMLDKYFDEYEGDDNYIKPTIRLNTSTEYMKEFKDKTIRSEPYQNLFKVLPKSVIGKLSPTYIYNWVQNKVLSYINNYDKEIENKQNKINNLKNKHDKLVKNQKLSQNALNELKNKIKKEKRKPTGDEQNSIDKFNEIINKYNEEIKELNETIKTSQKELNDMVDIKDKKYDEDFEEYIKIPDEDIDENIPEKYKAKINEILAN